jgi:ferredoxin
VKVVVDAGLCEAHGVCMSLDPTIFDLGDDDILTILIDDVPEDKREVVEQAVMRCPRQALSIAD